MTVVDDDQRDGGEGHAEKVEEERGGIVEGVFDEDEGDAPDRDYSQKEEVREGGWTEASRQMIGSLLGWWRLRVGVDGFAVDDGTEDLGVQEFLRCGLGDVAVEDYEVGEVAGFEAAF